MRQSSGEDKGNGEIKNVNCARTTARIRQHTDEEHKQQDPKMRRKINLRIVKSVSVGCWCIDSLCLYCCVSVCVYLCLYLCLYLCKRVEWMCLTRMIGHDSAGVASPCFPFLPINIFIFAKLACWPQNIPHLYSKTSARLSVQHACSTCSAVSLLGRFPTAW